jgi:hypothetical protein
MRALSSAEMLSLWDRTRGVRPLCLVLEFLVCAAPERTAEEWWNLPFGQVCEALFGFRSLMFGPAMPGVVSCPHCTARLEFSFACGDLQREKHRPGPIRISWPGESAKIRLPTPTDLVAARDSRELLSRCASSPLEPSPAAIEAASTGVQEADPMVETMLDLECPSCKFKWQALLDIVSYLSIELSHHARRLLGEIHRLANAYGWSEEAILAMSAGRRRAYLELSEA